VIPARKTRRASAWLESDGMALAAESAGGEDFCGGCADFIPQGDQVWVTGGDHWRDEEYVYCRRCAFASARCSVLRLASIRRQRPWTGALLPVLGRRRRMWRPLGLFRASGQVRR
jgi:hypothetical protein